MAPQDKLKLLLIVVFIVRTFFQVSARYSIINCNEEKNELKFIQSSSFTDESTGRVLYIDAYYNGTNAKCRLNDGEVLRVFEFERISAVYAIDFHGFNLSRHEPNFFKMFGPKALDSVKMVRDEGSDRTLNFRKQYAKYLNKFLHVFFGTSNHSNRENGIMVNAIEIETKDGFLIIDIDRGSWMRLFIADPSSSPEQTEQCLAPGKYTNQNLKGVDTKKVYFLNQNVTYCCNSRTQCNENRTCTLNGWSNTIPRCISDDDDTVGPLPPTNGTLTFYFEKYSLFVKRIQVFFNLTCGELKYHIAWKTRNPLKLPSLSVGNELKDYPYPLIKPADPTGFQVLTKSHSKICYMEFKGTQHNCTNCLVRVDVTSTRLNRSNVIGVALVGTDLHKRDWEQRGCPPIDPYVGMPDEYYGQAAANRDKINRNLREAPCRDGYRHYQNVTIKQCNGTAWMGDAPKCQRITCKRPAPIENGKWHYATESLFHKVSYTCDSDFVLSDPGPATCNFELNVWENVPECLPINNTYSPTEPFTSALIPTEAPAEAKPSEKTEPSIALSLSIPVGLFTIVVLLYGYLFIRYRNKENKDDNVSIQEKEQIYEEIIYLETLTESQFEE